MTKTLNAITRYTCVINAPLLSLARKGIQGKGDWYLDAQPPASFDRSLQYYMYRRIYNWSIYNDNIHTSTRVIYTLTHNIIHTDKYIQ